jgi:hypothetical protein
MYFVGQTQPNYETCYLGCIAFGETELRYQTTISEWLCNYVVALNEEQDEVYLLSVAASSSQGGGSLLISTFNATSGELISKPSTVVAYCNNVNSVLGAWSDASGENLIMFAFNSVQSFIASMSLSTYKCNVISTFPEKAEVYNAAIDTTDNNMRLFVYKQPRQTTTTTRTTSPSLLDTEIGNLFIYNFTNQLMYGPYQTESITLEQLIYVPE